MEAYLEHAKAKNERLEALLAAEGRRAEEAEAAAEAASIAAQEARLEKAAWERRMIMSGASASARAAPAAIHDAPVQEGYTGDRIFLKTLIKRE